MLAAWVGREAASEVLRADPGNSNLREPLKAAGKRLTAVRRFFEEFAGQLEARIKKDGGECGFCKHVKGVGFEGKESCSSLYIKEAKGTLRFSFGLVRDRWVTADQVFAQHYVASARPESR